MQQIEEYVVQEPVKASRVELRVEVILGEKAIVRAVFYGRLVFEPVSTKIVIIEGEEYSKWGEDDSYLERIVYEKLGLNKVKSEPIVMQQENNNI